MKTSEVIEALLLQHAVLCVRDYPSWANTLGRMTRKGLLHRLLPGVYAAANKVDDFATRCLALAAKDPDAVITGKAALKLTTQQAAPVTVIEFYSPHLRKARAGYRQLPGKVAPEQVHTCGQVRCVTPFWSAVETASWDDGAGIAEVLRQVHGTQKQLCRVFATFGKRWGNPVRRAVLKDSRDEPWSQAEKRTHQILRAGGLTGWKTNLSVKCDSRRYALDVAFKEEKLALEIDGLSFHGTTAAFHADRERQNDLVEAGWTVLRFTWPMLDHPDKVVATVKRTLARLRRNKNRAR